MDALTGLWLILFGQGVQIRQTTTTTFEDVRQAIKREFKEDAPTALAVAKCESNLRPNAVGDHGNSIGVMQINKAHFGKIPGNTIEEKKLWLMNFQNNIKLGKQIRDTSGFWPWTCFRLLFAS